MSDLLFCEAVLRLQGWGHQVFPPTAPLTADVVHPHLSAWRRQTIVRSTRNRTVGRLHGRDMAVVLLERPVCNLLQVLVAVFVDRFTLQAPASSTAYNNYVVQFNGWAIASLSALVSVEVFVFTCARGC